MVEQVSFAISFNSLGCSYHSSRLFTFFHAFSSWRSLANGRRLTLENGSSFWVPNTKWTFFTNDFMLDRKTRSLYQAFRVFKVQYTRNTRVLLKHLTELNYRSWMLGEEPITQHLPEDTRNLALAHLSTTYPQQPESTMSTDTQVN